MLELKYLYSKDIEMVSCTQTFLSWMIKRVNLPVLRLGILKDVVELVVVGLVLGEMLSSEIFCSETQSGL